MTLRGHTLADVEACAAMWADPRVTRHIGGRPSSEEEVWAAADAGHITLTDAPIRWFECPVIPMRGNH